VIFSNKAWIVRKNVIVHEECNSHEKGAPPRDDCCNKAYGYYYKAHSNLDGAMLNDHVMNLFSYGKKEEDDFDVSASMKEYLWICYSFPYKEEKENSDFFHLVDQLFDSSPHDE
jgi:hypothetical protein